MYKERVIEEMLDAIFEEFMEIFD